MSAATPRGRRRVVGRVAAGPSDVRRTDAGAPFVAFGMATGDGATVYVNARGAGSDPWR